MPIKITPVSDNYEKQQTYKELINKYNKAIQYEFYYEAILIDYALMEDRLRSCIYYLGLLTDRNAIKISKNKAKKTIKLWMERCFPEEKSEFRISSISGKRKIVITALLHFQSGVMLSEDNTYEGTVYKCLKRKNDNITEAIEYFHKCEEWCDYRNEIIHCLFNKQSPEVQEKLEQLATDGMKIARYFDKICSWFKWRSIIRKFLKLKTE